jgi:hypothetical protein
MKRVSLDSGFGAAYGGVRGAVLVKKNPRL